MLAKLESLGNRLPPRLKVVLNLAITASLALLAVPFLWTGVSEPSPSDAALGAGLVLLGVFNLFT